MENAYLKQSSSDGCVHVMHVMMWNVFMCVCVYVSVPQKDVWILAASLLKWDTQNRSWGLASRTQSSVNYHVSVCVWFRACSCVLVCCGFFTVHTYGCVWEHVCINATPPDIILRQVSLTVSYHSSLAEIMPGCLTSRSYFIGQKSRGEANRLYKWQKKRKKVGEQLQQHCSRHGGKGKNENNLHYLELWPEV